MEINDTTVDSIVAVIIAVLVIGLCIFFSGCTINNKDIKYEDWTYKINY